MVSKYLNWHPPYGVYIDFDVTITYATHLTECSEGMLLAIWHLNFILSYPNVLIKYDISLLKLICRNHC
jgi:hypothetical protein